MTEFCLMLYPAMTIRWQPNLTPTNRGQKTGEQKPEISHNNCHSALIGSRPSCGSSWFDFCLFIFEAASCQRVFWTIHVYSEQYTFAACTEIAFESFSFCGSGTKWAVTCSFSVYNLASAFIKWCLSLVSVANSHNFEGQSVISDVFRIVIRISSGICIKIHISNACIWQVCLWNMRRDNAAVLRITLSVISKLLKNLPLPQHNIMCHWLKCDSGCHKCPLGRNACLVLWQSFWLTKPLHFFPVTSRPRFWKLMVKTGKLGIA